MALLESADAAGVSPPLVPSFEPGVWRPPAVREALSRLEDAVTEIHDSDTFRLYLDAQARFHHYSWGNVLLILGQRPESSRVASYRTWQSLGRRVRRGETGIRIVVPMRRHISDSAASDNSEIDAGDVSRLIHFDQMKRLGRPHGHEAGRFFGPKKSVDHLVQVEVG